MNSISKIDDALATAKNNDIGLDVRRTLRTLWRRRWVVVSVLLLSLTIAYLALARITPIYLASSHVMIEARRTRIIDLQDIFTQMAPMGLMISSEVEVLRSLSIAQRVANTLDLYNDPAFNGALRTEKTNRTAEFFFDLIAELKSNVFGAPEPVTLSPQEQDRVMRMAVVNAVRGGLSAEALPQSLVIRIDYSSTDPAQAARLANAYADAYIDEQLEAKFETVRHATTWLNDRLETLRVAVVDSEKAVAAYKGATGLVELRGQSASQQQLSDLNNQLISVKAQRAELDARVSRLEAMLRAGRSVDALGEVVDSPLLQRLKEQEATLSREMSDLALRYGEKHPQMVKARAELSDIRTQINSDVERQVRGLRSELGVMREREAILVNQLRGLQGSIITQNDAEVRLRELEREAQANRTLYETFLNRFKESGEQEQIQQADSRVISQAQTPTNPAYPRRGLVLLAAAMVGLLGGAVLVLLVEQFDNTIRNREQLEETIGLPAFGVIPNIKRGMARSRVEEHLITNPSSSYAEAFRILWFALKHASDRAGGRVLVVTSSVPDEGKSMTALSLARSVALLGHRVLLVDADLRRASLGNKLELKSDFTIVDVLLKREPLARCVIADTKSGMDVLLGRSGGHKEINLLSSSAGIAETLSSWRSQYDLVVLDSPPVLPVADVQILASLADQTLFCVRWDKTARETATSAIRMLRDSGANLTGALLTRVDVRKHAGYGYQDVGYYYARYGNYYND
jgi:polysaccharide biosynthesis transport protein